MPGLRILTASYTSIRREGVRQEGDLLYLCMTLTGTTVGSRGGREMTLSDGDAVLMTNEEATWTMTSPSSANIRWNTRASVCNCFRLFPKPRKYKRCNA